jgi:putative aldouronate transport system substrate-binding protein
MKNGLFFTYNAPSEAGIEVTKESALGFPVVAVQVNTGLIKTSQPVFSGVGLPYTCQEPEAAMKFVNLLYTDANVMNFLSWGVEGVDYELEDGQIKYEGSNSNHYMGSDFILGNNLLLTPMLGNGKDFYQEVAKINESAEKSRYLGFKIDTTGLDDYIAQISAVNDQYLKTFQGGGYTPELHQEYLDKLAAADVQGYLDQVQSQLDAWLDANK